ncbi:MAG: TrkH family potassium uptake protein [Oscillospiraceae bacterium]|nr:TrkH family potassium uptake protein [Oscillospiraceae bacterium]
MNRRMIFYTLGKLLIALSALLVLPLAVSIYYKESCTLAFLITAAISLVMGLLLSKLLKPASHVIYAREGFAIVALVWLSMSAIGALPFVISGEIPSFADAFFETVSGFTTTGASILRDVESMSHGLLFWRSFTHWIGGMGVLVFVMALLPNVSDRSIHILRAEVPGPIVGKLVPRIKDTAKILYIIYIVLTVIQVIFLLAGGMSLFDSLLHAFGTAGTGGFSIKADGLAGYSPYLQWVIAIFMLIFGVNFNLYYFILIRKAKMAFQSRELWCYLGIVVVAVTAICINIYPMYENFAEVLRQAVFQVSSIITTTGYATTDFNLWPAFSKGVLFVLLFVGACAGSTAGGLKISRVMLVFKIIGREIRRLIHPRSVAKVKLEGKSVDEATLDGVTTYFAVYMIGIIATFLVLSAEPFGIETNFSAAVSCFNNVGPGFAGVGPMSSYADYSAFSKIVMSLAMLLGRLEIYPLLIVFIPSFWKKD